MHGLVTGKDPRRRSGDLELKLENPLGFFESERLVETNDALLEVLGSRWDRPPLLPACWDQPPLLDELQPHRSRLSVYALEHCWVDKDPRLCVTYPAYLHILLRRIPLIVALREPLAVATSLHARNGFSLDRGLVLWWIYNYHIAPQLCPEDLLILYSDLLSLDDQSLQHHLSPFLEFHNHSRPSVDQARALIQMLIKPEFNRSGVAINAESRARVNPLIYDICVKAYENIVNSVNPLISYQENFNSIPHAILECSARDQLLPESDYILLKSSLLSAEGEVRNVALSLEQRERDCASFLHQLKDLRNSRSWRITAPLRALSGFLQAVSN